MLRRRTVLLTLARHAAFNTCLKDLDYRSQAIWNTSQNRWFATTLSHSQVTFSVNAAARKHQGESARGYARVL